MFSHKLIFFALFLLGGAGCAYGTAMNQGAKLEAAGDWAGAYARYDAALKQKPDEVEAQDALERARAALVDAALTEARSALAGANYETVMEKLALAAGYDADRPEVFELRSKTKVAMGKRYTRLWDEKDADGAYDIAVRARTLFPQAEFLEPAFTQVRDHFEQSAKAQLKARKYPEALETLRTIVKFEPDRSGDIAGLEQTILQDWGADLGRQAQADIRARRLGTAAVKYARAYEVSGSGSYLEQSRAAVRLLEPEGKLGYTLRVGGPKERAESFRLGVLEDLGTIPDTLNVASRGKLDVRIDLRPAKCTEVDVVTPTEKDFVSGQVEEPNPEHKTLTVDLATQRSLEAEAKQKAELIWPDLIRAEQTLKLSDAALEEANRESTAAQTALSDAKERLARAKSTGEGLKTQLKDAEAKGDTSTAAALRSQLTEVAKVERQWADEAFKREDALEAAAKKVEGIEVDRGPAKEAAERLKKGHDGLLQNKTDAQAKARSLAEKLSTTPATVWKDVHELLKYDVHDYTRTCVAPMAVQLGPTWETTQPVRETYEPAFETKDQAHIGHVKAQVEANPKAFPQSDDELIAKGDAATRAQLKTWLEALAADHFAVRRMQTTLALVEQPQDTTELVRLYVGAQGRLDDADLKMFATHLKTHFGLEKIELLRSP